MDEATKIELIRVKEQCPECAGKLFYRDKASYRDDNGKTWAVRECDGCYRQWAGNGDEVEFFLYA